MKGLEDSTVGGTVLHEVINHQSRDDGRPTPCQPNHLSMKAVEVEFEGSSTVCKGHVVITDCLSMAQDVENCPLWTSTGLW